MLSVARTRATGSAASREGERRSERSLAPVKAAVLTLIEELGPLTGQGVNERFRDRVGTKGWPSAAFESPRKRTEELARNRVLVILNEGASEPALYDLAVRHES